MAAKKKVTKKATKKKTEQIEKIPFWVKVIPIVMLVELALLTFDLRGLFVGFFALLGLNKISNKTKYAYLYKAVYILALCRLGGGLASLFAGHFGRLVSESNTLPVIVFFVSSALILGFQLLLVWLYKIVAAKNTSLGDTLFMLAHAILWIIGLYSLYPLYQGFFL